MRMFKSATIKLTAWYLCVIMAISVFFSILIFNIASHELDFRLERFQSSLSDRYRVPPPMEDRFLRNQASSETESSLISQLVAVNTVILLVAGGVSYLLARKTMRPIQSAHEAQSRFTSDASHELRTPLAAMKTETEVTLHNKESTKKDYIDTLKSNLEEVNNLSKLVAYLLDMSSLENSRLNFSKVDINKTLDSAIKKFKIPNNRIEITRAENTYVRANRESIDSLISILLDNAIKYSPDDSIVKILVKKSNEKMILSFSNEGSGIPSDKLPYIFDRFYRAEPSRNKSSKSGYGLGLAIAKQITTNNKGNIHVVSKEDGVTTFTVELPIFKV